MKIMIAGLLSYIAFFMGMFLIFLVETDYKDAFVYTARLCGGIAVFIAVLFGLGALWRWAL